MPRLLILFSLCNLVLGTGVFVITGILPLVAQGLGVSVPAAGQSMTAYALSTAVLAPALLLATGSWPRKRVLCMGMALFGLGSALCAAAPDLSTLLAGRVLMGVGAVFTPVAAGIAVASVEPARRGKALALVFVGVSLSYVIGLPLGAWLGHLYGWRTPLWLLSGLIAVMVPVLLVWVPARVASPGASFAGLTAALRQPGVLAALALTLCYFSAIFLVFSYIGPVLQALLPMSSERLSLTLMLFGLSGVAGTLLGGVANDRLGPNLTLLLQLMLMAYTMLLLPLTAGNWNLMVLVLMAWGTAGFGMMAPQQSRLAALAPSQAPMLLSLNSSMLYLGTAGGAALGGAVVSQLGFARLSWLGAGLVMLGLCVLIKDFGRHEAAPGPAAA